MLLALQFEHDIPHPLQFPLTATKPLLQARQREELVVSQVMQFLGHPPQEPFTKAWPGGQEVQLLAVPAQLTQFLSQGRQEEPLR
jgi:hypothetical protein